MKRRSFLALLGLAPAAVALPKIAEAATKLSYDKIARTIRPMTALEIEVLKGTTYRRRVDLLGMPWMGHTFVDDLSMTGSAYEYAELFDCYNYPTADQRADYHERALVAFQRLLRKQK